jgi:hypothetical protein
MRRNDAVRQGALAALVGGLLAVGVTAIAGTAIVQENIPPSITSQPAGSLFGVQ